MLKVKPTMVEEGHFERILCEAYENCTDAAPIDENAKPDEVGDGQIERERSHELRQRMREALLMRWDTVETNLLTDVQKQMGVCNVLDTLQPIADLVVASGKDTEIADATRLFALICPRVKQVFPHKTLGLDCQNLHSKVIEFSKDRDVDKLFHIGSCCNCPKAQKKFDEMSNMLDKQHDMLRNAFEKGKAAKVDPLKVSPEIVDSINSTGVRVYTEEENHPTVRKFNNLKDQIYIPEEDSSIPDAQRLRMKVVSQKTTNSKRAFVRGAPTIKTKKSPPHLRQTPAERAMTSAIAKMAVQDSVNADDLVKDLDKEFENELNALDN